jgi:mannobiose 2-epimerase
MMDHAIEYGWDKVNGGFFYEGYYFEENSKCKIIKDSKVWWAQAEGLNALLLFSKIFPEETRYYQLFLKQWEYIKKYLIDYEHGDWYWGSLEKEPFYAREPKSTFGSVHITRQSINELYKMLDDGNFPLM